MMSKICVFTDYFKFRAELRGFDLIEAEKIVRYSQERYFDTETQRIVAVGEHGNRLVMIPYEESETEIMSPLKYRSKSDDFSQARDLA